MRDEEEDRLDLPSRYGVDDIPLVVQDRVIDSSGRLVYPLDMHSRMMGVMGERIYVNGTANAVFEVVCPVQKRRVSIAWAKCAKTGPRQLL